MFVLPNGKISKTPKIQKDPPQYMYKAKEAKELFQDRVP